MIFAQYARNRGSLVEAVNQIGSYFYPVLLGVFTLAFFLPPRARLGGFLGYADSRSGHRCLRAVHHIAYLWYNVLGAVIVVVFGVLLAAFQGRTVRRSRVHADQSREGFRRVPELA